MHATRGFLSGDERNGAHEGVVDLHLHAGDRPDGNGVVAVDHVEPGVGSFRVEVNVGRDAEVDVERRGAVALHLVGGRVIPERDGAVGARPARGIVRRAFVRQLERVDGGLRAVKHIGVESDGLSRLDEIVGIAARHDQQLAGGIAGIVAHSHGGRMNAG